MQYFLKDILKFFNISEQTNKYEKSVKMGQKELLIISHICYVFMCKCDYKNCVRQLNIVQMNGTSNES
jgi:hypothetical protein